MRKYRIYATCVQIFLSNDFFERFMQNQRLQAETDGNRCERAPSATRTTPSKLHIGRTRRS
ncbi:hypothetical protein HMPREF0762_01737 [Slackia exigua ATCC 700122]|uniref:Uncharacterized protein n=1 Tax=Slackia exigua (strain ATCC 700122 / DSM 15923 / CIP 105133 / JCM 11022 / KCTC 5966 / S-7) TaxID=649764 RepID=D0WIR2_SLAES|nr:hypothetical protein HMPREF0762_01737 [Slackia exigua ATCC 700122]